MNQLLFSSPQHQQFYQEALQQAGRYDSYHRAFFYLVGATSQTREGIGDLFDFTEDVICPAGLEKGWQTGSTARLCRLAFNLWNGYAETGDEKSFTPYELFDCSLAPYMLEGIRLRYPEYCRDLAAPARLPQNKGSRDGEER